MVKTTIKNGVIYVLLLLMYGFDYKPLNYFFNLNLGMNIGTSFI